MWPFTSLLNKPLLISMLENRATIAAIMPLYNKEKTVARSLNSIFAQSRIPDEILIIDDGSTDSSFKKCQEAVFGSEFSERCKIYSTVNKGVSAARNFAIRSSVCDYVAFIDADDEWLADHISELLELIYCHPYATIFSTAHYRSSSISAKYVAKFALSDTFFGEVFCPLRVYAAGRGLIQTSCVAVKKSDLSGGPSFSVGEKNGEDVLLWVKLLLSYRMAFSAKCTAIKHDYHSGISYRVGSTPAHLVYFLGSYPGRLQLRENDLTRYLYSEVVRNLIAFKMRMDEKVVKDIAMLSRSLGLSRRVFVITVYFCPVRLFFLAKKVKKKLM